MCVCVCVCVLVGGVQWCCLGDGWCCLGQVGIWRLLVKWVCELSRYPVSACTVGLGAGLGHLRLEAGEE